MGTAAPSNVCGRIFGQLPRTDAKVLITGESGVGKEIVSRLIHADGARGSYPLVTVNCAAITETLLESELFGHERGQLHRRLSRSRGRARNGPPRHRVHGRNRGDEPADAEPAAAVPRRAARSSGSARRGRMPGWTSASSPRPTAICCSGVAAKTFREDLYYRLNVIHLTVPPLRDRVEDIPLLLDHFMDSVRAGVLDRRGFASRRTRGRSLLAYHWPGNVRELKNLVERLTVRSSEAPTRGYRCRSAVGDPSTGAGVAGGSPRVRGPGRRVALPARSSRGGSRSGRSSTGPSCRAI